MTVKLKNLQADQPDFVSVTNPDDLAYLVRRFAHESGQSVGQCSTHADTLRELAACLCALKLERKKTP